MNQWIYNDFVSDEHKKKTGWARQNDFNICTIQNTDYVEVLHYIAESGSGTI